MDDMRGREKWSQKHTDGPPTGGLQYNSWTSPKNIGPKDAFRSGLWHLHVPVCIFLICLVLTGYLINYTKRCWSIMIDSWALLAIGWVAVQTGILYHSLAAWTLLQGLRLISAVQCRVNVWKWGGGGWGKKKKSPERLRWSCTGAGCDMWPRGSADTRFLVSVQPLLPGPW